MRKASDFTVGQRVELSPACDYWMRGARYGDVASIGSVYVIVQLDKVAKPVRVNPAYLHTVN